MLDMFGEPDKGYFADAVFNELLKYMNLTWEDDIVSGKDVENLSKETYRMSPEDIVTWVRFEVIREMTAKKLQGDPVDLPDQTMNSVMLNGFRRISIGGHSPNAYGDRARAIARGLLEEYNTNSYKHSSGAYPADMQDFLCLATLLVKHKLRRRRMSATPVKKIYVDTLKDENIDFVVNAVNTMYRLYEYIGLTPEDLEPMYSEGHDPSTIMNWVETEAYRRVITHKLQGKEGGIPGKDVYEDFSGIYSDKCFAKDVNARLDEDPNDGVEAIADKIMKYGKFGFGDRQILLCWATAYALKHLKDKKP